MFEFFTAAHGLLADNKIVALASTGPKRSAYLPDVPTAHGERHQGLRGAELERHFAFPPGRRRTSSTRW